MNANGLVAYVVTFHQTILAFALAIAVVATLSAWFLIRKRPSRHVVLLVLFSIVLTAVHVGLSSFAGFTPLSVEVVRVGPTSADEAPPAPRP